MRVALTGATGFIGGRAAARLAEAGHKVTALRRRESKGPRPKAVGSWLIGDLCEQEAVSGFVAGADVVIHAAVDWQAAETGDVENWRENLQPSLALLNAARRAGVGQFIFLSSVAVFHARAGDRPFDEDHPTWPDTAYGAYKAAFELQLKSFHLRYGMNTSAWRPGVVYGPRSPIEGAKWYDLVDQAGTGPKRDRSRVRKVTHVDDVAEAVVLAVGDPEVAGQQYNLVDAAVAWDDIDRLARWLIAGGRREDYEASRSPVSKRDYTDAKALAFFVRHGRQAALRRGFDGVGTHIEHLVSALRQHLEWRDPAALEPPQRDGRAR